MYGITFSKIKGEVCIFLDKKIKKLLRIAGFKLSISLEMRRYNKKLNNTLKHENYYFSSKKLLLQKGSF